MPGSLEGVTVLDLTWGMAGPITTMVLADHGAEVIRIERPEPDPFVSPPYAVWNRNKLSVELDLADEAGAASFRDLVARADVLVESYRPGAMRALGFGYEQVRKYAPHLVYCSVSGYGQRDRARDRPGYDALVAARFGLMGDQRGYRDGPIFLGYPVASYGAALLAVIGVTSALLARESNGHGQHVDTSLVDGALANILMFWRWSATPTPPLHQSATRRFVMGVFECSDREYVQIHTGVPGRFRRAMELLGLAGEIPAPEGPEEAVPLTEDEAVVLQREVPLAFARRPRARWLDAFAAADICITPLMRPGEAFDHEQVRANELITDVDDPALGPIRQVGVPVRMSRTPGAVRTAAPVRGEHTVAVLARNGDAPRTLPAERSDIGTDFSDGPLTGLRCVDFGAWFAGPYSTKIFADLGAEVIKVEALTGDPLRPLGVIFSGAQRGKRNLALDLKHPDAREIVHELVRRADVVTHNMRPGVAERLGIDDATLRRIKPDLVYCYAPGWGSTGPLAHAQGFAPLYSGFCGILYEASGEGNFPLDAATGNEDATNGLLAAGGILMALLHRAHTGEGQSLESPQVSSTLFTTSEVVRRADGTNLFEFRLDAEQTGLGPRYRLYRARRGWICIACVTEAQFRALCTVLGCPDAAADPDAPGLADVLAARFATRTVAEWTRELDEAGVPCERARPRKRFFEYEKNLRNGRAVEYEHPTDGRIREVGSLVRFSGTPGRVRGPAALLGEHTVEILTELGFEPDRIDELRSAAVVVG